MSACTRCRWGTGTTHEKMPDTAASKEIQKRLSDVMAERAKQDSMWCSQQEETQIVVKKEVKTTKETTLLR